MAVCFFDLEGWFEDPFRRVYNLEKNISSILHILKESEVVATFNVCGIIAENKPKIIKKIFDEGHELASHGYAHENFSQLTEQELNVVLGKTETIIENITGKQISGVRAPWLLIPPHFYRAICKRGYKWTSNAHVLRNAQIIRPDRGAMPRISINAINLFWKGL